MACCLGLGGFAGDVPPDQYLTFSMVLRVLGSRGIRNYADGTAERLFSARGNAIPAAGPVQGRRRSPAGCPPAGAPGADLATCYLHF